MSFFKPQQPILQKKQLSSNPQQLALMKCLIIKPLETINLSGIYTCIDQAMVIWGFVAAIIFLTAQFFPIDWTNQAIFWSIITLIGILTMTTLTHTWTVLERISWLLYTWVFLMIIGILITDYAVIYHWGFMLSHLCELWLILSSIGYLLTGWGLRSRAFFIATIIHGITIFILPYANSWQFGITGLVMMTNLLIFSEAQWDMLLPRELRQYSRQPLTYKYSSSSYFPAKKILINHQSLNLFHQ
ncbi:hypothetical protein [Geminocystis sp. GBBB08]|uniref:hypothetical protein n=1 Tax=Geminocystis sp. GBBB08 TaxID=2604140 RepID=UPI0027E23A97|nr:hypothetical protein [Geminocystis sp. GBBB08]